MPSFAKLLSSCKQYVIVRFSPSLRTTIVKFFFFFDLKSSICCIVNYKRKKKKETCYFPLTCFPLFLSIYRFLFLLFVNWYIINNPCFSSDLIDLCLPAYLPVSSSLRYHRRRVFSFLLLFLFILYRVLLYKCASTNRYASVAFFSRYAWEDACNVFPFSLVISLPWWISALCPRFGLNGPFHTPVFFFFCPQKMIFIIICVLILAVILISIIIACVPRS